MMRNLNWDLGFGLGNWDLDAPYWAYWQLLVWVVLRVNAAVGVSLFPMLKSINLFICTRIFRSIQTLLVVMRIVINGQKCRCPV